MLPILSHTFFLAEIATSKYAHISLSKSRNAPQSEMELIALLVHEVQSNIVCFQGANL
jgi:hypothetical protein